MTCVHIVQLLRTNAERKYQIWYLKGRFHVLDSVCVLFNRFKMCYNTHRELPGK